MQETDRCHLPPECYCYEEVPSCAYTGSQLPRLATLLHPILLIDFILDCYPGTTLETPAAAPPHLTPAPSDDQRLLLGPC